MINTYSKEKLTKSALITIAVHMAAAAVLFSKPIYLNPHFFSQIGRAPSTFIEEENITLFKRNVALEEAFNHFEIASHTDLVVHSEIPRSVISKLDYELPPVLAPTSLALPKFKEEEMLSLSSPELNTDGVRLIEPPFAGDYQPVLPQPDFMQTLHGVHYQVVLPPLVSSYQNQGSFEFIPSVESPARPAFSLPEIPKTINPDISIPSPKEPLLTDTSDKGFSNIYSDFSITPSQPRSIAGIRFDIALADYGLPALQMREWNECFDLDVKTYAKEAGGYLFSIQMIPKVNLADYKLKQNYLFIIDRSNSKDKSRVQSAKRAAQRALSSLRPGDYFNIAFLDSTLTQFSPEPVPFNKTNCQLVEEFLEKQSNKSSKGSTDIYSALTKVLNPKFSKDEAITAILISDGGSTAKSHLHRIKINEWLQSNHDHITLHTATCGSGINLSSLKMLSLASRGTLLYSDTHAAFPRKLAKLVMDLRYPIAKEMSVSVAGEATSNIKILPPSSRLPNLFSDHPYVLLGSCDQLTDFTLILEGKNKDDVFTIKKLISLANAKPGSRLLLKQWNAEKAHALLDQYLLEGEKTLLQQAEKDLGHDTQNSRR